MTIEYRKLTEEYDSALAALIRTNLRHHHLDIPGTVYFDEGLDHLSRFYSGDPENRFYYVLLEGSSGEKAGDNGKPDSGEVSVAGDSGKLVGGIGLAAFGGLAGTGLIGEGERCAELQKLYLDDTVKGRGIGYEMIRHIEDKARELGFHRMYLETHTNLQAAMHIYEKSGYALIERPVSVMHSTMNRFYLKQL